ncbi:MAG TPA: ABC transporter substrate-binding protein [Conexibacter sp.]|nr:ABC transporter substrate-binding protein [Conexibacter sp.]
MLRRVLLRLALALPLGAAALAGCGGAARPDPQLRGARLDVYSSLPSRGPLSALAAETLAAERLALAQDGGRVGRYRVRLIALDASTPGLGRSDPGQISIDARQAAQDPQTIAYLGELATGTSAISIPLTNEAGILQVSPLDAAMALTTASAEIAGSPVRYYPKLKDHGRTFARVVPSDRSEADVLLAAMRRDGVRRLALLTDEDPSGRALAAAVAAKAPAAGIHVAIRQEIDEQGPRDDGAIAQVVAADPQAALDTTVSRPGAAALWRELAAADPKLALYAPASVADRAFLARLGSAGVVAHVVEPTPGPGGPAADRFARAFAGRYGYAPSPMARFGYEAMRGVLAAIRRAEASARDGRVTRSAVVRAYFRTDVRDSPLGRYAIERSGDTTLRGWSVLAVVDGLLRPQRPLAAAAERRAPLTRAPIAAPRPAPRAGSGSRGRADAPAPRAGRS